MGSKFPICFFSSILCLISIFGLKMATQGSSLVIVIWRHKLKVYITKD